MEKRYEQKVAAAAASLKEFYFNWKLRLLNILEARVFKELSPANEKGSPAHYASKMGAFLGYFPLTEGGRSLVSILNEERDRLSRKRKGYSQIGTGIYIPSEEQLEFLQLNSEYSHLRAHGEKGVLDLAYIITEDQYNRCISYLKGIRVKIEDEIKSSVGKPLLNNVFGNKGDDDCILDIHIKDVYHTSVNCIDGMIDELRSRKRSILGSFDGLRGPKLPPAYTILQKFPGYGLPPQNLRSQPGSS
ncbi:hypothetical protein KY358_02935 [Candidatus Woesearchaeota archaeon]|nr:hypothetical protein [Candidatus Woesearchaeota archaeon]